MRLSTTELNLLAEIAKGNQEVIDIAKALKKSRAQIYRAIKSLNQKGFLDKFNPTKATHTALLLQLLDPSIIPVLSGSGLELLISLQEKTSVQIKRSQAFAKLKLAKKISLIKEGQLNEKLWPNAVKAIKALAEYERTIDPRIPTGSIIYQKKELVFSSTQNLDAYKTAFSAYSDHGIKIRTAKNYYCLKKPTRKDILLHSLAIERKDHDPRHLIYIALFWKREKIKLSDPILENLQKILEGESIPGYPSKEEIKERADLYQEASK
jgi:biotin operon repressor